MRGKVKTAELFGILQKNCIDIYTLLFEDLWSIITVNVCAPQVRSFFLQVFRTDGAHGMRKEQICNCGKICRPVLLPAATTVFSVSQVYNNGGHNERKNIDNQDPK